MAAGHFPVKLLTDVELHFDLDFSPNARLTVEAGDRAQGVVAGEPPLLTQQVALGCDARPDR
jgi:hypothetical protein